MKSSDVKALLLALLGLGLFGLGAQRLGQRRVGAAELARLYQAGFCGVSVHLIPAADCSPLEAAVLRRRLERADIVRRYDPERLRATTPFTLQDDGRFWAASAAAPPSAFMRLDWGGSESGQLELQPWDGPAWQVPLRSKALVLPDWSAYSGLVAYYDLGRVWIADLHGKKFQSLVQEPLLENGGVLKFSADGTALAFYFHANHQWLAQNLYVLKGR
ncbi:MAG TPA: hypothetical protein VNZ54_09340 [bacterium]|nr:hypothetical protein [bacterium]